MFKRKEVKADIIKGTPTIVWEGGQPNQSFNELVQPMVKNTPDWYKKTKRWVKDDHGNEQPGLKHCIPFLDALTTGYGVFLAEDVFVSKNEDGQIIVSHNNVHRGPVSNRMPQITDPAPIPPGCLDEHYIWSFAVAIELPPGYSALYTHPLNRWELPFISTSAIIDDYNMPGANMAFHLKIGFEGIIPAGTMIAQMIPFRREEWASRESTDGRLWQTAHWMTVPDEELLKGWYRSNIWKKKVYK